MNDAVILGFPDYAVQANQLATALDNPYAEVKVHYFPDGECKLTLPTKLEKHVIVCRSLHQPNAKLLELYLLAKALREQRCTTLTLVAPYLCYMRQDTAFSPGEVVSQRWIGEFLGALFDEIVTVDPHLHRVDNIADVFHSSAATALSASQLIGEYVASRLPAPVIVGPDEESLQWVQQVAQPQGFDFFVARKTRQTDRDVSIELPTVHLQQRDVVLVDDVASTGNTLREAAKLLRTHGANNIYCAVTHALFINHAYQDLKALGIKSVWSTDSINHMSNKITLAPLLANAIRQQPSNCNQVG